MENLHDKQSKVSERPDQPESPDESQSVCDHPEGAKVFEILTDCMDNGHKDAIPKGSDFYGKPISLEQLEAEFKGRKRPLYVLVCTHGIYIVLVRKVNRRRQKLDCYFLNLKKSLFPDRFFRFSDILECYHVYRVGVYFAPTEQWECEPVEINVQPSTSLQS